MDKVVCYWGSWSVYRQGNGQFNPENIDPRLCTHLIYSFVSINAEGDVVHLDAWNDQPNGKGSMNRFNALKSINPRLKTMVAIGGWNEGSTKYSQVMANPRTRGKFVNSVFAFVTTNGFDGLDLDWEYPADRGGVPADKENFASLLRELRDKFDERGLLLSAAVAAGRSKIDAAYDVPSLSRYLDFINVMTYDLHGSWDGVTGHNSPLYASSVDKPADKGLNVYAVIQYWLSKGAPASKLVLGVGTYGRTFTLSTQDTGLGAPISGPGLEGPYTKEPGFMGYNEICEQQKQGLWPEIWDDQQKVPHAVNGRTWVGYDNVQSVKLKAEFAKSLGLGGVMLWSLETDDFLGIGHGNKFPLLRAIYKVVNGGGRKHY